MDTTDLGATSIIKLYKLSSLILVIELAAG